LENPDETRGAGFLPTNRTAVPVGSDDWSELVDLLLEVTYKKAFRHSATLGASSAPRGTTAISFLAGPLAQHLSSRRLAGPPWRPPFDGFEEVEDESPGAISH
jgi:hypothetical protein